MSTPVPLMDSLATPAAVVDLDVMHGNIARMAAYAAAHGLGLRPHVKTHKSPPVAQAQLDAGALGVTCATTFEAHVMSQVADDVLVMYPPVGAARLQDLLSLPADRRVITALDSREALMALAAAARAAGRTIGVLIEADLGMRRVGLGAAEDVVELAQLVARVGEGVRYEGVAFYPGHVREHVDQQGGKLRAVADRLDALLAALTSAGCAPGIVSGGSTPAAWRMHELPGLTEVRPGTYVFNDRTTADIGACRWEECALTVLTTVVSTAVAGQAVVDAGTKALGREPVRAGGEDGFAVVQGQPDVQVHAMSEEHGVLDLRRTRWRPKVGDQLRLIPNHVCIVVHLNDALIATRGGQVLGMLPVTARGRGAPGIPVLESLAV